jgi:hypothetical protein
MNHNIVAGQALAWREPEYATERAPNLAGPIEASRFTERPREDAEAWLKYVESFFGPKTINLGTPSG